MAFATGRERSLTALVTSRRIYAASSVTGYATGGVLGVSAGLTLLYNSAGGARLTVAINWLGGPGATYVYNFGTTTGFFSGPPFGSLLFADVTASISAVATCREYYDESDATLKEKIVEWQVSLTVSGSITTSPGGTFSVSKAASESRYDGTAGWSGPYISNNQASGYGHTVEILTSRGSGAAVMALPALSIGAGASISGTGIAYSGQELSFTDDDYTLSGYTYDVALALGARNSYPDNSSAAFNGAPDWAVSVDLADVDYETGGAVAVDHYHNNNDGAGLTKDAFTTNFRYPTSGYRSYHTESLVANDTTGNFINHTSTAGGVIFNGTDPEASAGSGIYRTFHVDPAWAESYGTLLWGASYSGSRYRLRLSSSFPVANLTLAASHRYTLFDSAAGWNGTLETEGGGLALVTPFLDDGAVSWIHPYAGAAQINCPTLWKPYAYRYYRLRVKANTAGAELLFQVARGGFLGYRYQYCLPIRETDTWQECEIDLAFPTYVLDFFGEAVARHVVHPDLFNNPTDEGAQVRFFSTGAAGLQFHVDYVEGFYKPESGSEDRIKALLIGPLSVEGAGSLEPPAGLDAVDAETCSGGTQDEEAATYARLVVNGCLGMTLAPTVGGTLRAAWQDFVDQFDSAANDTGITIALTTDAQAIVQGQVDEQIAGYYVSGKPWRELTPGTPFTVEGVLRKDRIFGYYGMGDPEGSYAALLAFHGTRVWNGEACGLLYSQRSEREVGLALADSGTETTLEETTSNLDGFYRLFGRYGHGKAFSNGSWSGGSVSGSCTAQYSGSAYPYSGYTAAGQLKRHYYVQGEDLWPLDADEFYLTEEGGNRWPVVIVDRYPVWQDLRGFGKWPGAAVAETHNGLLFAASCFEGAAAGVIAVRTARSLTGGDTWEEPVTVAEDAHRDAAPCLVVTDAATTDVLWCWYHTADGAAQLYVSDDYGAEWALRQTFAGRTFPRALWDGRRFLVAAATGDTTLALYESTDHGLTLEPLATLTGIPAQAVALARHRLGAFHLVYRTEGGAVVSRRSGDGVTWEAEVTLASAGKLPAFTAGYQSGYLASWNGAAVEFRRTDETLQAGVELMNEDAVPDGFVRQTLGLVIRERREHALLTGLKASLGCDPFRSDGSPNDGESWVAL